MRTRWVGLLAVALGVATVVWWAWRAMPLVADDDGAATGVAAAIAVTALLVQGASVAGTTALLAAMRRTRLPRAATAAGPVEDEPLGPIDVVVRFDGQPIGHLHATLAGVRHLFDVHHVVVVTDRVDEVVRAVRGTGTAVVAAEPSDPTRLRTAAGLGEAPFVAMFDAGDVPRPGFTGVVRGPFADPVVGVVQGCATTDGVDSAEHDAHGHHELRFEREVLDPALGARGHAVFLGSGALVRRDVLRSVPVPRGARRSVELRWSIAVRAAGHRLCAPYQPIVSAASLNTERAVAVERRRSVRAAIATLTSRHSPLWTRRLPGSARVGYAAWMVRPLSGWRRLWFVAVLLAAVATGVSPVRPGSSAAVLAALWAGWFVTQAWAVGRASYGVLRPGDRTRWSLRTMGASLASTFGAGRTPVGAAIDEGRVGGWRDARRNPVLTSVLVLLAAASVAMGIDRWVPVLPVVEVAGAGGDLSPWARAAAATVSVWCVALILDVMRCLVGGPQLRAAQRLKVRLEATIDEVPARITNLSPRGAGIRFGDREPDLVEGDEVAMRFLVPTGSGTTAEVATIATVRTLRIDEIDGMTQLVGGVEFGTMDRISADALFAYCAVLHPARLADADDAERRRAAELVAGPVMLPRFAGARLVGAIALLGIGSAMMPPYGVTTAAPASPERSITVRVVDDTGAGAAGAVVTASCVQAVRLHGSDADESWPSPSELVHTADEELRAQQRDRVAARTADLAARDVRRELTPSPQIDQLRRQRAAAATLPPVVPPSTTVPGSTPGWLPVPAVDAVVGDAVLLDDRGNGTYALDDLAGWPCRVELATPPPGFVAGPITPAAGAAVQFVDGGDVVRVAVVRAAVDGPVDGPVVDVGDRVWFDVDADGVQDPGEPGVPDVTVVLTADGSVHEVTTGADGSYRFTSDASVVAGPGVASGIAALRVGATVQVQVPSDITRGASAFHLTRAGAAPTIGSSVDPLAGTTTFVVEAPVTATAVVRHDLDVGYAQAHAIGDRVWLDADNDGRMGAGEQGVDGVTVALYVDAAGDGVPDGGPVAAQVTGQGGLYAFGGVPAGTYVIDVFPPAGMVSSTGAPARLDGPFEPPAPGANDDDDDGRLLANGVIRSGPVTVGASPLGEPVQPGTASGDTMAGVPDGRGDATVDFGLFPTRAIDDGLWFDQNGDGVLSPGEPGLGGVPIALVRGDEVLATTITDAAGDFLFPNLTLGEYELHIGAPAGLHSIDTLPRPDDELVEAPEPDGAAGDVAPAADADGDGVPDVIDETPDAIADDATTTGVGVTDELLDALDGTVDGVFNGIVQDAAGDPATPDAAAAERGTAALRSPEIAPTAPGPAEDPAVEIVPVTVAPDWAGLAADRALQRFGMWAPRSIGHRVWEDADDDGSFDAGEVGIPGIEVRLVRGAEVVATTVSAADGTYRFNDLPDGTYRVVIDVPATWRTAQVGWDQPVGARSGIDHGSSRRSAGRAVSPPIRLGRLTADDLTAAGAFDRAGIGLFQPRPSLTLEASVRGCSAVAATGTTGPRGSCAAVGVDEGNPVVASGATLTWVYVVTNTGNTPLHDVAVTDDVADGAVSVDCNAALGGDGQPFTVEPGRAVTCTVRDRVGAGPGRRTAMVAAVGETAPNSDASLEPVSATTHWFGAAPGLALTTAVMVTPPGADADGDGVVDGDLPPAGTIDAVADADVAPRVVADGTPVWWVYDVSNTSTDALADVSVVDAERGRVCSGLVLAPGEHRWCVVTGIAAGAGTTVRTSATASATDVSDPTVSVPVAPTSDTAAARVARPELVIETSMDGADVAMAPTFTAFGAPGPAPAPVGVVAGRSVELTYTVANTGDTTFSTVALADSVVGVVDCPELSVGNGGLEPGERVSCTMRRVLTAPSSGAPAAVATVVRVEGQPVGVATASTDTPPDPIVVEERWAFTASTVSAGATVVADTADAPVSSIEVRVLDERSEVVATTTTDAAGAWRVTGLTPGRYSAQYQVPAGYLATLAGEQVAAASDGTVVTSVVAIDAVPVPTNWDLALVRPGSLADAVWADEDGDGRRDASERGVAGAVVALLDDAGSVVATTVTGDDGRWWFDEVRPGHTRVTVHAPQGHVVWREGAASGAAAATVDATVDPMGDAVWATTTHSFAGRVWDDDEGNGWVAPGARGAPNVVVTLVEVVSGVVHPVAVTATDNIGRFSFDGLAQIAPYEVVLGRVVEGTEATTVASFAPTSPPTPPTPTTPTTADEQVAPSRPVDAFDVQGTRLAITAEDGTVRTEAALSISPLTQPAVAPGRPAPDHSFFLSTADLVPTSAVEAVQAVVFVLSLVVFSTVVATMRRRRLR